MATKTRSTGSRTLVSILIGLVVLIGALLVFSRVWTEVLWYRSIDQSEVYRTRLLTTVALFAVFALLMGASVLVNLFIANRMGKSSPAKATRDPKQFRLLLIAASALVAIMAGNSASGQIDLVLGWLNRTPFNQTDAYFGKDVSFYVFSLPWWQFVCGMCMAILVVSTIGAALLHLVNGSLRTSPIRVRAEEREGVISPEVQLSNPFNRQAQAHLSVLLGLILVVYGIQGLLARYAYAYTDNGLFTGIGYTDDHSRITARLIVSIIAFICAGVFFLNAYLRLWSVSIAAIVLMVVSSLIISIIYPMIVQRFQVKPDEPIVERPYIANHITATRSAYDIDDVDIADYSAQTTVSAGQLKADAEALPGIRLMDPAVIAPAFEQLQQVRGYYSFPAALDVDRYTIDEQNTDAIVAVREIDHDGIPDQSWNNVHTVFTHGYAMVAAYGNRREANGEPSWIVGDIPPEGALSEHQARVYFGERTNTYAVVGAPAGTAPVELDTPGGGDEGTETRNTYDGAGGVDVGSLWRRVLFALRFGDLNLLLSDRVNDESVILYDRTPTQRVQKAAPWLTLDSDPYPAIVDGRLVWIVDGYTTSDNYPNSQHVDLSTALSDSQSAQLGGTPSQTLNYMRNSVKATVDAQDGTVSLYAWDTDDPILQTWMKVFPNLLKDKSEISDDLMSHLRYPEDLFKVQRQVLGRYHTTNPDTWYQQSDLWQIPSDPRTTDQNEPTYYLSIKWPGDESVVFSQTAVYVPNGRENLGSYLAVVADASSPDYGKLRVLKLSDTQQIAGPGQTFNAITTDQTVAETLLPYIKQGSAEAIYGNLLTLPLGGGLIYVQPIYTQRQEGSSGSYPVLRFVVVRFGDHIGIGETLQEALDMVFAGDSGASTGEEEAPPDETTDDETATPATGTEAAHVALQAASDAFTAANAALKNGDLAEYQKQVELAQAKMAEAQAALA